MRIVRRLGLVGAVLLGLTGFVRAGDRETALALIEQAIKAHGGDQALTKAQTVARTVAGTLSLGGDVSFTGESTLSLPGRAKQTVQLDKGGQVIIVLNGDRGWRSAGGAVNEMTKEGLDELREEVYIEWLLTLVPLKKDGFDLTPLADKMVDGKPAAGLKVASRGHFEARLYFDKASNLLVKVERQSREPGFEVNKEYLFGGHKDFDGVKLPTTRMELFNGKKFVGVTSTTYRFLGKVDDAAFARP